MKHADIVTIGNGTGQGVVLKTLRKITDMSHVSALVGVTDNGGHTGAIRREMGIPAIGDTKTIISALTGETVWGQLFRHRFTAGRLKGVSIGNLLLAALVDEGQSLFHGTRRITQALGLKVNLMPISDVSAQLVSILSDGTEVTGEWETIMRENQNAAIVGIRHEPVLEIHPEVIKAVNRADWIIICPGTLWLGIGSILASPEIHEAISKSKAIVVAVGNILTQPGVTDGMSMKDHWKAIEKLIGREINHYIQHDKPLPEKIKEKYLKKGFIPVENDFAGDEPGLVMGDLVSLGFLRGVDRIHYDAVRGYPHALRHDPAMLARIFVHVAENVPDEPFIMKQQNERYEVKDF